MRLRLRSELNWIARITVAFPHSYRRTLSDRNTHWCVLMFLSHVFLRMWLIKNLCLSVESGDGKLWPWLSCPDQALLTFVWCWPQEHAQGQSDPWAACPELLLFFVVWQWNHPWLLKDMGPKPGPSALNQHELYLLFWYIFFSSLTISLPTPHSHLTRKLLETKHLVMW